jgi:hypothetical protein
LASITASPDKESDALVDSGATNHVMSLCHLFVWLNPTNVQLRVASEECLPVDGVGNVVLNTLNGPLCLLNVLFCPCVKGTVISVSFFNEWDGVGLLWDK